MSKNVIFMCGTINCVRVPCVTANSGWFKYYVFFFKFQLKHFERILHVFLPSGEKLCNDGGLESLLNQTKCCPKS